LSTTPSTDGPRSIWNSPPPKPVFERCRPLRIEPPSIGRVDGLVRSAFHIFEERWCASVSERLDVVTHPALDDLEIGNLNSAAAIDEFARTVVSV
jgi:hypothetical protein